MSPRLALVLFLLLTVGGGALIGLTVETGGWYRSVEKPAFNPPDWLFAPVWTALYVLIGIAGWRVWRAGELGLSRLWWTQLVLNFAWPPIFFKAQMLGTALLVLAGLVVVVGAFVISAFSRDRVSALLFLPYLAWTAYAGLLNASIWWLNR